MEPKLLDKDNRRHDRVAVTLDALVAILIPENTFQPIIMKCQVLDLSERGAMIVTGINCDLYSSMLQKTRYCRLTLTDSQLPIKVTGRAVWLQPMDCKTERTCRIGLFFEDCPTEVVNSLRQFVEKVKEKTASPPPP